MTAGVAVLTYVFWVVRCPPEYRLKEIAQISIRFLSGPVLAKGHEHD
jgi:hypothetical protein